MTQALTTITGGMAMMNKYSWNITFKLSMVADSGEQAMEYLNKKYFNMDSETCSFVNIPVDEVEVYLTNETRDLMQELGEDGYDV